MVTEDYDPIPGERITKKDKRKLKKSRPLAGDEITNVIDGQKHWRKMVSREEKDGPSDRWWIYYDTTEGEIYLMQGDWYIARMFHLPSLSGKHIGDPYAHALHMATACEMHKLFTQLIQKYGTQQGLDTEAKRNKFERLAGRLMLRMVKLRQEMQVWEVTSGPDGKREC